MERQSVCKRAMQANREKELDRGMYNPKAQRQRKRHMLLKRVRCEKERENGRERGREGE